MKTIILVSFVLIFTSCNQVREKRIIQKVQNTEVSEKKEVTEKKSVPSKEKGLAYLKEIQKEWAKKEHFGKQGFQIRMIGTSKDELCEFKVESKETLLKAEDGLYESVKFNLEKLTQSKEEALCQGPFALKPKKTLLTNQEGFEIVKLKNLDDTTFELLKSKNEEVLTIVEVLEDGLKTKKTVINLTKKELKKVEIFFFDELINRKRTIIFDKIELKKADLSQIYQTTIETPASKKLKEDVLKEEDTTVSKEEGLFLLDSIKKDWVERFNFDKVGSQVMILGKIKILNKKDLEEDLICESSVQIETTTLDILEDKVERLQASFAVPKVSKSDFCHKAEFFKGATKEDPERRVFIEDNKYFLGLQNLDDMTFKMSKRNGITLLEVFESAKGKTLKIVFNLESKSLVMAESIMKSKNPELEDIEDLKVKITFYKVSFKKVDHNDFFRL